MDDRTAAVVQALKERLPGVVPAARVVGTWVWLEFDAKPSPDVRAVLKEMRFYWNKSRGCWQNRCGHRRTGQTKADPRMKYGSVRVVEEV